MFACRLALRCLWSIGLVFLASAYSLAEEPAPEALLSAKCVVAIDFDGFDPHRAAFDRTALAELLRGDLGPLTADLRRRVTNALGPDVVAQRLLAGGPPDELTALAADAEQLPRVFEALRQRGLLVGVELAEGLLPGVQVTLVFPGGGSDEVRPAIQSAVRLATRLAEIKLRERTVSDRTLLEGGFLGLGRMACWQEGPHFVVTIGTMPPEGTIALAEGKAESLAHDPQWKELCSFDEYETYLRARIDTERLQRIVAQWVPPAKAILEQLGLDSLTRVSVQAGFEGRYQRLTTVLTTPTGRRGVLKLLADGQSLDLETLPALPADASIVWTLRAEPFEVYRFGIETIEKILSIVEPGEVDAFRSELAGFESALGGDAMKKALDAVGPTLIAYNEPGGAIPFFGGAFAIEVKDLAVLEQAREAILGALEQAGVDNFTIVKREYRGTPLYVFQSKQQFFPIHPAFAVHEGWLHIALSPQAVQGAIFRASAKERALQFSGELQTRIEQRVRPSGDNANPRKLLAFSQSDPRPSVKLLVGVLPLLSRVFGAAGEGGFFQNFDTTLVPHSQPITETISHNFSMLTADESTIRFDVYSTLPMPVDFASFGTLFAFAGF
ncbi:MAG: hypothetical protein WD894_24495 [Pirellulales bacterium]